MKRNKVLKELKKYGWWLLRHGRKHDITTNGVDEVPVGRHPDIPEITAKEGIIKIARNNPGPKSNSN